MFTSLDLSLSCTQVGYETQLDKGGSDVATGTLAAPWTGEKGVGEGEEEELEQTKTLRKPGGLVTLWIGISETSDDGPAHMSTPFAPPM